MNSIISNHCVSNLQSQNSVLPESFAFSKIIEMQMIPLNLLKAKQNFPMKGIVCIPSDYTEGTMLLNNGI